VCDCEFHHPGCKRQYSVTLGTIRQYSEIVGHTRQHGVCGCPVHRPGCKRHANCSWRETGLQCNKCVGLYRRWWKPVVDCRLEKLPNKGIRSGHVAVRIDLSTGVWTTLSLSSQRSIVCQCDQEIYRITVAPLAASLHGKTIRRYSIIANIGHDHLIASTGSELHLITTSGQLVNNITKKTGYSLDWRIVNLTSDDIQVLVEDRYETKEDTSCLVCLNVSEDGSSVSLSWTYDVIQSQRDPILTSGVVIVPCSKPNAFILIDRYSGQYIKRISPTTDPEMGYGTCIYNDRLFIGAGGLGVVMEFHILGKYSLTLCLPGRIL
jgi:hypothetical protein